MVTKKRHHVATQVTLPIIYHCLVLGSLLASSFPLPMPLSSDSSYTAVTRHRRTPNGRPVFMIDEEEDDAVNIFLHPPPQSLPHDDIPVDEAAVAPLLEEGELDADAIVVSPTGNSAQAAHSAGERRRREEGWTDFGLDAVTIEPVEAVNTMPVENGSNAGGGA